jgi:hypothetical protein
LFYHRMPAGLYRHGHKLLDLLNAHPPDNPVSFDAVPAPPPGTLDAAGNYRERVTDEWGTTWENWASCPCSRRIEAGATAHKISLFPAA